MNVSLPRTSAAARFQAVLAAVVVTLTLLSGIDSLALHQAQPMVAAAETVLLA